MLRAHAALRTVFLAWFASVAISASKLLRCFAPSPVPPAGFIIAAPLRRQLRQQPRPPSPLRSIVSSVAAPLPATCDKQETGSSVAAPLRRQLRQQAPSSLRTRAPSQAPSPFRRIQLAINRNQAVPAGSTHYTYFFVVTKCFMRSHSKESTWVLFRINRYERAHLDRRALES